MPDPFDAVQPIGSREPEQLRRVSAAEKQRRRTRTRANAEDKAGQEHARQQEKNPRRRFSRRPLRVRELIEMTSELARFFHAGTLAPETKPHESKHFGVGYGVMVDKLNTLEGRPTEILAVTDELRPAAQTIAGKLALVRKPA